MVYLRTVRLLRGVMYELWTLVYKMVYRLIKWCSFPLQYFM